MCRYAIFSTGVLCQVSLCQPSFRICSTFFGSCYFNGSLLLLFLPISRHSQNILGTVEHVASISVWQSPHPSAEEARVSLIGRVTLIENDKVTRDYRECYVKAHPDAAQWLPDEPDSPHLVPLSLFDTLNLSTHHSMSRSPIGLDSTPW